MAAIIAAMPFLLAATLDDRYFFLVFPSPSVVGGGCVNRCVYVIDRRLCALPRSLSLEELLSSLRMEKKTRYPSRPTNIVLNFFNKNEKHAIERRKKPKSTSSD